MERFRAVRDSLFVSQRLFLRSVGGTFFQRTHHPLRKRDINPFFSEFIDNLFAYTERYAAAVGYVCRVAVKLEVQTAVAKVEKRQRRSRIAQNLFVFSGDSEQDFLNLIDIAVIVHPDIDVHSCHSVVVGLVNNTAGDNGRVWDDNVGFVARFQSRRAHADLFDHAFITVDDDQIAELYRSFKQNGNAGNQIADDVLQT